jgi:Ni,Fe-hydrogenase maturation factor
MARDVLPGGPPESQTAQRADIVVFACGDPAHAEHESIAIAACTSLPAEVLEQVDIKLVGPMRPEYLQALKPGTHVVIADTVPGASGEIAEIAFIDLVGREEALVTHSTPDHPLDEVIAMAELLRDEPIGGWFVGLAAETVDLRYPADASAVETLRAAVVRVLTELAAS